ncbi:cyclodeaminase/cyclohydrolase family protein [Nesterenkonia marinintestina]|uniref:cyclodeaminase/cyclohydrolase family protein n=1 Tax=Nesterenkonia marinintestina TaxID=2979865 RepID=UPI0021BF04CE|nr:cyclodeaminase/cyclohydrolase family protein [Nesterenkonia sp. GX14115]
MDAPEDFTTRHSTVDDWTDALAEAAGSPGGGAGAGVMLGIAASLTSMVAGYTEASPEQRQELDDLRARARELRGAALQLADDDADASQAFGAAFSRERGPARDEAIHEASLRAAQSSAELGELALDAVDDLMWLTRHGNMALVADVVVACGALRAAITGARTNVSFDLATMRASGLSLEEVRQSHPDLWDTVRRFEAGIERLDEAMTSVDDRAAPTAPDR